MTAKLVAADVIDAAPRRMVEQFFMKDGTVVTSVSLVAAGGRKPGADDRISVRRASACAMSGISNPSRDFYCEGAHGDSVRG